MTFNYRCSIHRTCGKRVTLKKHINLYKKYPMCPSCGKDTLIDVTKAERARTRKRTCTCDGNGYPHRRGTEPWCVDAKEGPSEQDYQNRYRRFG